MKCDLKHKNILITGASSGIGRAVAEELIGEVSYLFLVARRIELLNEIKNSNSDSKTIIYRK
jgi:NADP-dependent 3-hydroxy acid dehydrogenase YdfG